MGLFDQFKNLYQKKNYFFYDHRRLQDKWIIQFYLIIIDDLVRQLTNLLYLRLVGERKAYGG